MEHVIRRGKGKRNLRDVIKIIVIYRIILFIIFDSSCFSYRALQFFIFLLGIQYRFLNDSPCMRLLFSSAAVVVAAADANIFW